MGLDISTLAPLEEAQPMTVEDPRTGQPVLDDEGNPLQIWYYGQDSEPYRRVVRANQNRRLQAAARGRRNGNQLTADQLEAESLEVIVSCCARWGQFTFDGVRLDCTPANARRLHDRLPWLREQADAFITERAHFFGTSKPSSSPSPSTSSASPAP